MNRRNKKVSGADRDLLTLAAIAIIFVIVAFKTIEEHRDKQRITIPQIEKKIHGR